MQAVWIHVEDTDCQEGGGGVMTKMPSKKTLEILDGARMTSFEEYNRMCATVEALLRVAKAARAVLSPWDEYDRRVSEWSIPELQEALKEVEDLL